MNFSGEYDDVRETQNKVRELTDEYIQLKRFKTSMLEMQPYREGDRVALSGAVADIDYTKSYGWSANKKILQPGNVLTVVNVDWNGYWKYWFASVMFDVEWSTSTGFNYCFLAAKPVHHFAMPFKYIRPAREDDRAILPGPDYDKYQVTYGSAEGFRREDIAYDEVLRRFSNIRVGA